MSLLVGCGPTESAPPAEPSAPADTVQNEQAPLTTTDVDVAPECEGILQFANTASFFKLDRYLPSDAANNIIAARTVAPFTTLARLSGVSEMGPVRLKQLEHGARAEEYIDQSCLGIYDELALSQDDAAAIVTLVNTASPNTLYAVLPYAWNGATSLINLRPFTSVLGISNAFGIGSVSLRNLRNAATIGYSLEMLVSAVNALPEDEWEVKMSTGFNIETILDGAYGTDRLASADCFGIDLTGRSGQFEDRGYLADATEVRNYVHSAVSTANRYNAIDADIVTDGKADLAARTAGRTFKGCHMHYENGPWAGVQVHFFVDTASDFRILTVQHWVE
ncbi:hypothetical protein [Myxococcus sp. AB025B]|uniref:hypothetical protein n=1 Tax=Myxococcus sp. AB025B TaxID=2562794 RepID=UPI001E42550A|nr:hypothetical protein [Myxococcus sp. AB025B]